MCCQLCDLVLTLNQVCIQIRIDVATKVAIIVEARVVYVNI